MSILAQQNIVNGVEGNDKWSANLGAQSRDRQEPHNYFTGYSYRPAGVSVIPANDTATRVGPKGTPIANQGDSYGPPGFNRLSDSDADPATIPSLLTGFAYMMGARVNVGEWGRSGSSQRLKNTITSGDQMRSLWNSTVGVNNVPVASGGQFAGYQHNHQYGITNWNPTQSGHTRAATATELFGARRAAAREHFASGGGMETVVAATDEAAHARKEAGVDDGSQTTETVRPMRDITDTGIRVIQGMMGPRSETAPAGNDQSSRSS